MFFCLDNGEYLKVGSAIFWCLAVASVAFFPVGVTLVVAGIAVPIIQAAVSILSSIGLGLYYWRYYAKREDREQLKKECVTELHKMHDSREKLYLQSKGLDYNRQGSLDVAARQQLRDNEQELFTEEGQYKLKQGTFRFWGGVFSIIAALTIAVGIMFPALGAVVLFGVAVKVIYLAAVLPCIASVSCSLGAIS